MENVFIFNLFLYIIAVEAISDILVNSDLIQPFKSILFKSKYKICNFIHDIFDCTYCMSVWISFILVVSSLSLLNINTFIEFIVVCFFIHKMAIVFHNIFLKVFVE